MSEEPLFFDVDPKQFRAHIEAANTKGETKTGEIQALWLEDELYPRLFVVVESDHPWVRVGDKVYVVAGAERPQG